MLVPKDLCIDKEITDLKSKIYITRYVENAPSKILTRVSENLLVIILQGKKKISCDNYITTISEGEFGFFKKGNYIMNQILSNEKYESLLIFIPDEYLNEILDLSYTKEIKLKKNNISPYIQGCTGSYMKKEVEMIVELINDDLEEYNNIVKMKIKELLLYIIKSDSSGEMCEFIYNCSRNLDNDFRKYMESNFDKSDNLKKISSELNMSLSTFKRKFQLYYETTPGKWINEKRLEKAEILLQTTDYSITDICFLCGYESLSNFIYQFKKIHNITPRKYRKNKNS